MEKVKDKGPKKEEKVSEAIFRQGPNDNSEFETGCQHLSLGEVYSMLFCNSKAFVNKIVPLDFLS